MRILACTALAGLVVLASGRADLLQSAEPGLSPRPLQLSLEWNARQFVQADAKGRVFLLRGDTLEVYPLAGGKLGKSFRLRAETPLQGELISAAMSGGGSRWLLASSSEVLYFEDGEQKTIPAPGWVTTAAGFSGEDPVVAVLPMRIGKGERPRTPPQVLKFDGRKWELLIAGSFPERTSGGDPLGGMLVQHTVSLAPASKSRLWMFYPYAYRVGRFSSLGKRDLGMVVSAGKVTVREDQEQARKELEAKLEKGGYKRTGNMVVGATLARRLLLGVAQGRDGRLYVVSRDGEGVAMDRYDPVTALLERSPLRISYSEELSLAAGRDGLVLAGAWGKSGRWSLTWEEIDGASWKEVSDVEWLGTTGKTNAAPEIEKQD